jgi:hypothetical protein
MYLYFFNDDIYEPYKIFIIRIESITDYEIIINNTIEIFQSLIDNDMANKDNIMIFSLIKEYTKSIENIILPFSHKNISYADKCEEDQTYLHNLIKNVIKNYNCNLCFEFKDNILEKEIINHNLYFLLDKY